MARVTVEDCVLKIPNRFELVMVSSQRAREISSGSELTIDRDNDKNTVVALREIADETVNLETLKEALVKNYQKVIEVEDEDEDIIDVMEGEEEWVGVAEHAAESEATHVGMHEDNMSEQADTVGVEEEPTAETLFK